MGGLNTAWDWIGGIYDTAVGKDDDKREKAAANQPLPSNPLPDENTIISGIPNVLFYIAASVMVILLIVIVFRIFKK
jgi:hypothetical protein